jgi:hypothetical protein
LKLLRALEDERYLLLEVLFKGRRFVYLKDSESLCESFGVVVEGVDVTALWSRHKSSKGFCLPCELLLLLAGKVVVCQDSHMEAGISLKELEHFKTTFKLSGW